jgi:hypothetical protein
MNFQQTLAFGHIGENYIMRYLRRRGWTYLPVYELEMEAHRKGPRLFMPDGERIAPDCLVFQGSTVRWVEAKRKTTFTWYRKERRWTTGIDIRCYEHYLEIRERHAFDLWLLFLHPSSVPSGADAKCGCPPECPAGLFGGEIQRLARCESHRSGKWGSGGMVYWAAADLQLLATVEEVLAATPRPPVSQNALAREEKQWG